MDFNWYEIVTTIAIMALLVLWVHAGSKAGELISENQSLKIDLAVALAFEELYRTEEYKDHGEAAEKSFKEFSRTTMTVIKEKNGISVAKPVRVGSNKKSETRKEETVNA